MVMIIIAAHTLSLYSVYLDVLDKDKETALAISLYAVGFGCLEVECLLRDREARLSVYISKKVVGD
jgi:hypothetical protein